MVAVGIERRKHPRLRLRYPIRVDAGGTGSHETLSRTITQDVSARGACFSTFHAEPLRVGRTVSVEVTVPHRLAAGDAEAVLGLRADGTIVRVEGPEVHGVFGEDGLPLSRVAIAFAGPLAFRYRFVEG